MPKLALSLFLCVSVYERESHAHTHTQMSYFYPCLIILSLLPVYAGEPSVTFQITTAFYLL